MAKKILTEDGKSITTEDGKTLIIETAEVLTVDMWHPEIQQAVREKIEIIGY